jgi:carboxy-terminal domain RNA polymerase II polypeptide A small phosphatase
VTEGKTVVGHANAEGAGAAGAAKAKSKDRVEATTPSMRELQHGPAAVGPGQPPPASGVTTGSMAGTSKDADLFANTSRTGAKLSRDETADVLSGAVVPPGADGSTPRRSRKSMAAEGGAAAMAGGDALENEESEDEFIQEEDEDERIIAQGGMGIPIGEVRRSLCTSRCLLAEGITHRLPDRPAQDGLPRPLLAELSSQDVGRKCLILDLDETLVHSSFKVFKKNALKLSFGVPPFVGQRRGPYRSDGSADYTPGRLCGARRD